LPVSLFGGGCDVKVMCHGLLSVAADENELAGILLRKRRW
jgi:hypothetical protein